MICIMFGELFDVYGWVMQVSMGVGKDVICFEYMLGVGGGMQSWML